MVYMKNKLFLLVYISLIVGAAFVWYFNKYVSRRTTAAQDAVTVALNPNAATFDSGTQKDIDVIIQSPDAIKKISGVDLMFNAEGPIKFIKVSRPAPFPGEDTSIYNSVVQTINDQNLHISHVSLKTDAELPSIIHLKITVEGIGGGVGKVKLDQAASQVVGNITGKLYAFGGVDEGVYTINDVSTNTLNVKFLPSPVSMKTGETRIVDLGITGVTAGQGVSGFHFVFNYDPSIIDITSIDDPIDASTGGDAGKFTKIKKDINAATGVVDITYVSTLTHDQLPKEPLMKLHVLGKQIGNGQFTITTKEITGNIPENAYNVVVSNGTYEVTTVGAACNTDDDCLFNYVCSQSKVCEPLFCPLGFPVCKEGSIANHKCVIVDAPDGTPCGNGLSCQSGQCVPVSTPTVFTCTDNSQCADNQICSPTTSQCVTLPCDIVTAACMKAVARNHSCVIEQAPDGTLCPGGICESGLCKQISVTPTLPPTGNVKLNMKLKLQGILNKPAASHPLDVKITIAGGGLGSNVVTKNVVFVPDGSGVWSGMTAVNVPAGNKYKVFVKGPQHLQKRICVQNPTETSNGTYRCGDNGQISLKAGDNTLDFSGVMLLTGDLPDQDGIVDSYDLAYMRLNFGSTDPKALAIADLNQDGLVDTQDYSLVIASLSVKYDEI